MGTTTDGSKLPEMLHDLVLIAPFRDEQTEGGIILPDTVEKVYAVVAAVGPGKLENGVRTPMDVEVGDLVMLSTPRDIPMVDWGGKQYGVCKNEEIGMKLPTKESNYIVAPRLQ